MAAFLLTIAIVVYTIGVVLAGLRAIYGSSAARRAASAMFALAWVAHLSAVAHRAVLTGALPLTNRAEFLLVLGWAVMTLHLLVWFRFKIDVAGLVLPPVAALSAFAALTYYRNGQPQAEPGSGGFLFHTTVSTLGLATLCVALTMSIIYVVQDRALKSHKTLRLLERLPTLDRCDQIGLQALTIGFGLLTVGIFTGILINAGADRPLWSLDLKQAPPLLAWGMFAAVLGARRLLGWRGRKSAYMTIAGVSLGLLTVAGIAI